MVLSFLKSQKNADPETYETIVVRILDQIYSGVKRSGDKKYVTEKDEVTLFVEAYYSLSLSP